MNKIFCLSRQTLQATEIVDESLDNKLGNML